jgi:hypothetical protein
MLLARTLWSWPYQSQPVELTRRSVGELHLQFRPLAGGPACPAVGSCLAVFRSGCLTIFVAIAHDRMRTSSFGRGVG